MHAAAHPPIDRPSSPPADVLVSPQGRAMLGALRVAADGQLSITEVLQRVRRADTRAARDEEAGAGMGRRIFASKSPARKRRASPPSWSRSSGRRCERRSRSATSTGCARRAGLPGR